MKPKIQPVILLGGSGTRLWPLSRKSSPKQFHALTGERTMFQETLSRLSPVDADLAERLLPPILVGSAEHELLAVEQMAELGQEPGAVICEPMRRNTAPAFAAAALIMGDLCPGALMLLLPADHHIEDETAFHRALAKAASAAARGNLVTFGIVPDRPETGYGYIRKGAALAGTDGAYTVDAFVEKPDRATAESYLASGDYLWNSGMFVFHVEAAMEDLRAQAPRLADAVAKTLDRSQRVRHTVLLDAESFDICPSDSIDYAVMEHTKRACVVPSDFGWSDVGSFETLWSLGPHDDARNRLKGDVVVHNTKRTFVDARSRLVAAFGVEDLVIVETPDAVLVARRDHIHDLKKLIDRLKADGRPELD